jgi:hypothetical protein
VAGGSGEDFRAGIERAIALGWLWLHESGTYVKFTGSGAAMFAWRQVHLHGTPQSMMVMDMKPKQRAKATAAQLDKSDRQKWPALIEAAIRDAENDIIARLSEKLESQADPLSPSSAAAIVRRCIALGRNDPMMARIAMMPSHS